MTAGPATDGPAAEGSAAEGSPEGCAAEGAAPGPSTAEGAAPEAPTSEGAAPEAPTTEGPTRANVCPSCGRAVGPADNFCEACRTELAPAVVSEAAPGAAAAVCPHCQSAQTTTDGYCASCGYKLPSGRDHLEIDLGLVAGVTDRGLRHRRNEDAMALATTELPSGPAVVAVVCDGVSSSQRPDDASLAAAQAAVRVLLAAARTGQDLAEASRDAVTAAQSSVAALAQPVNGDASEAPVVPEPAAVATHEPASAPDPPSATFVSAVMTGEAVTLCWLGDSRAYWLAAGHGTTSERLTTDDSLGEEMVAAGLLSEDDVLLLPQAHVVTGWIGADTTDVAPHVTTFEPPGPGVLLLCSDGLWNYQPEAAKLAGRALPRALRDPLGAGAALVSFAIDAGGMDNITVVLAPFPLNAHTGPAEGQPEEGHPDEPA